MFMSPRPNQLPETRRTELIYIYTVVPFNLTPMFCWGDVQFYAERFV